MTTSTERCNFTHGLDKPYSVTLWVSNPDGTTRPTTMNFGSREEAILAYREVVMFPDDSKLALACGPRGSWEYVVIDGPETYEITQNPDRPSCARRRRELELELELERFDGEWRRERAMEAGIRAPARPSC